MTSPKEAHDKQLLTKQNIIYLVIGVLVIIVLAVITFLSMQPERSAASFCRVAKEQKSVLLTGSDNYEKRLEAYRKLEAVSPDEIRSDISTIRKGYESIVANPSNMISAGLGMSGAENQRTDYITRNCTDF